MKHYEFLYILHRAHLLRKFIEGAEKMGEEFHVSDHFSPLESGLGAQSQIRRINLDDAEPSLILRLRYPAGSAGGPKQALEAAHVFFAGKYTALPMAVEGDGWVEHVFFSPDVPRPVALEPEASASA